MRVYACITVYVATYVAKCVPVTMYFVVQCSSLEDVCMYACISNIIAMYVCS